MWLGGRSELARSDGPNVGSCDVSFCDRGSRQRAAGRRLLHECRRTIDHGHLPSDTGRRVANARISALAQASPVTYVQPSDPPFLIFHGTRDAVVPLAQSQELASRLQAAGVSATLVMVQNGGHGFTPTGGAISPTLQEITQSTVDFLSQHLQR